MKITGKEFQTLAVAWAIAAIWITAMPFGCHSFDAFNWQTIADAMIKDGINPYRDMATFRDTPMLNWPPFWMQIIWALGHLAIGDPVRFLIVLQIFLTAIESLIIIQTIRLIRDLAPGAPAEKITLFGIVLNPIILFNTFQHCNFDAIVGLWVIFFVRTLIRFNKTRAPEDWLLACLFLGCGIATKTVPVVLIPLLAGGFFAFSRTVKFIGVFLVFGLVSLGMSIIYVLSPSQVTTHVLQYRSDQLHFGVPGFCAMLGITDRWFEILYLATGGLLCAATVVYLYFQKQLPAEKTLIWTALALAGIVEVGCGGNYFMWFTPLLIAACAAIRELRPVLVFFFTVAIPTFIFEYGMLAAYGFYMIYFLSGTQYPGELKMYDLSTAPAIYLHCRDIMLWLDVPAHNTLERIPLFIALTVLLLKCASFLFKSSPPNPLKEPSSDA